MTHRSVKWTGTLPAVGLLIAVIAIAAFTAACETTDSARDDRYLQLPDIIAGEPVAWPFRPAEMRIHPLTRLATDDEGEAAFLEVRIEFRDADGHTTRGLGELIVDLRAADGSTNAWRVDLTDRSVNAERFDDVSRTYLLRLRIDRDDLSARPQLRAIYNAADGRTLTDERRME